jgi:AcrR family transcriptional regulator
VATRAGVSESVFHDVFSTVEECYLAAFEKGLEQLSRTVTEATTREQAWLERARSGLVALLGFFDDEPSWGRLLVGEAPLAAALTFECTQQLHNVLAGLLEPTADLADGCVGGRADRSPAQLAALTGELVAGGVLSVIHTSMLEKSRGKLVEMAPSLMAFIVAPYLGQVAAQAELQGRPSGTGEASAAEPGLVRARVVSRAGELPIRATRRTTLVLRAIARAPYSNNREVAQAAGLADEGQTSKLLTRLERRGVIENVGVGAARGEPNAWRLTPCGRRAVELLAESFDAGVRRPRNARAKGTA